METSVNKPVKKLYEVQIKDNSSQNEAKRQYVQNKAFWAYTGKISIRKGYEFHYDNKS